MLEEWVGATDSSWSEFIEANMDLLSVIESKVLNESKSSQVLPKPNQVLRCLNLPLSEVRVVIVGQDPYPNPNHACGLAFAIEDVTQPLPKSLKNIQRELVSDVNCHETSNFDISRWQSEGVLLINRVLTVSAGNASSHSDLGWQEFTLKLLKHIADHHEVVFILWGNLAIALEPELNNSPIIKSAHPSPLSAYRGFFGSKPFSKVNDELSKIGVKQINWCVACVNA